MSDLDNDTIKSYIEEIRTKILPYQHIDCDKFFYVVTHLHLAKLYFALKDDKKAAYHLTECHGVLLRHHAVLEDVRREGCFGVSVPTSSLQWEYLSSSSDYAKDEDEGLFRRLSEMPPEWTILQLTRSSDDNDHLISAGCSPELKEMFVSRMQCGPNPEDVLVGFIKMPLESVNVLNKINEACKLLKGAGIVNNRIQKIRRKAAQTIQGLITDFDEVNFTDWKCVFLGKLQDSSLENKIRAIINNVLNKAKLELTPRVKQFLYLLAEGSHCLTPILIRSSLEKLLPDNNNLKMQLYGEIINVRDSFDELSTARRHPVILIVEDHLDLVPWENMPVLKNQPVTRLTSVHFLHALFKSHQQHIHHGLREISEDKISYYVLNPEGNLPHTEARLKPFFQARLPKWIGLIGEKPSTQDMINALTSSHTYIYCGHGSGSQYLGNSNILRLNLADSVQLLFGCQSAALNFLGGGVPMTGDMLHYSIAGSACSLGMLYLVISDDVDAMTSQLANLWLPGTPINPLTLKPIPGGGMEREPELLRVLPKVREVAGLFSNKVALISRGLPIKLVP